MGVYARRVRYRSFDKLRHSTKMKDFLAVQANRLSDSEAVPVVVVTSEDVFDSLKSGNTARQIESFADADEL